MKSLSAAGKFKKKRYQEENQKRKVKLEKYPIYKIVVFLTIKINERLHWRVFSAGLKTLRPWREL